MRSLTSKALLVLFLVFSPFGVECKNGDVFQKTKTQVKEKATEEISIKPGKKELTDNTCRDIATPAHLILGKDIGVSPSGTIYVAANSAVYKYDGKKWCQYRFQTPEMAPGFIYCINKGLAILGLNDKFIVYVYRNYIFKFDGKTWELLSEDEDRAYADVWISSRKEIYVVGVENGHGIAVVIKDGGIEEYRFKHALYAVWGGSDDEVIAVGEDIGIYRYKGSTWETIDTKFTKAWRKKNCAREKDGGIADSYRDGMCQLNHVAGNPQHGYYLSTDNCSTGPGCMMLRYKNDKVSLFKKDLCGPMWMDRNGILYACNHGKKDKFFKIDKGKLKFFYKYDLRGVQSIRGQNENNIFSIRWSKENKSVVSKFDGKKWFPLTTILPNVNDE